MPAVYVVPAQRQMVKGRDPYGGEKYVAFSQEALHLFTIPDRLEVEADNPLSCTQGFVPGEHNFSK